MSTASPPSATCRPDPPAAGKPAQRHTGGSWQDLGDHRRTAPHLRPFDHQQAQYAPHGVQPGTDLSQARACGTCEVACDIASPFNAGILDAMFGMRKQEFIQLRRWLEDRIDGGGPGHHARLSRPQAAPAFIRLKMRPSSPARVVGLING